MEHIHKRLDELGVAEVKRMHAANELPTNWAPHIREWLATHHADAQKPREPQHVVIDVSGM